MPTLVIRTRYKSHPGSNVGDIEARVSGTRRTVRCNQALTTTENHRRAADKIADHFGLTIQGEPVWLTNGSCTFEAVSS